MASAVAPCGVRGGVSLVLSCAVLGGELGITLRAEGEEVAQASRVGALSGPAPSCRVGR